MAQLPDWSAGPIVTDGAWSSVLRARGLAVGAPAELANLTHASLVEQLARDYAAAGARIISTNTFAANALMLQQRGAAADVRELNLAGARLARRAAGELAVAGVIGPTGRLLGIGEITDTSAGAALAEQAAALAEGGVDMLVLETFSELRELLVAVEAVRGVTSLPLAACMSFDSGPQRTRTVMGAEAAECAAALQAAGADLVGCNCGAGPAAMLPAVVALRGNTSRPLWVRPSVGLPELEDGRPVYRASPEEFATAALRLVEAGASAIGGCCGAGPEHIQRLAAGAARVRG